MKRFVSILLILVLVFAMSSVAFAATVVSPENGNTNPDVVDDGEPSPQTSDMFSILFVIAVGVLSAAVVMFCGKKLLSK